MALREEIYEKLASRAASVFSKKENEINEAVSFTEDLNAKSVHISQITTYLEDSFDTEIPYMEFRRRKTIGEAVDYVLELIADE